MGFFSFVHEIAMDLGTANTIIISDDKIVVDEPSVVALDRRTDKMIAVGNEAKLMYEKTQLHLRRTRGYADHRSQGGREKPVSCVNHLDESAHHLLAGREVGYHTVSQRTDGAYVVVRLFIH